MSPRPGFASIIIGNDPKWKAEARLTAIILFLLLWTPVSLFAAYSLPESFGAQGKLGLGIIIWLIGGLLGFYYLVAGKWR